MRIEPGIFIFQGGFMQFEPKKVRNLNISICVGRGTLHIPKDFKEALIKMQRVKPNAVEFEEGTFLTDEEIRVYNFCANVIRIAQYRISKMTVPLTHRGAVYYNNATKHYKINLRSENHLSTFTLEEEGAYVGCDHVVKEPLRQRSLWESPEKFGNEIVVIKKVAQPKLTLTPNRMTIKCNEHHENREQLLTFSEKLRDELQKNLTHSLRGCFFIKDGHINIILKGGLKGKVKMNFTEKLKENCNV